jgi:hypothetical protein
MIPLLQLQNIMATDLLRWRIIHYVQDLELPDCWVQQTLYAVRYGITYISEALHRCRWMVTSSDSTLGEPLRIWTAT